LYLLARNPRKPVLAFAAAVAVVTTRPVDLTTAGVVITVAGGPD
jgi:hypothetical protein